MDDDGDELFFVEDFDLDDSHDFTDFVNLGTPELEKIACVLLHRLLTRCFVRPVYRRSMSFEKSTDPV